MNKTIAILPGDGIGSEVMSEAVRVLMQIEKKYHHTFKLTHTDIGGTAFEKYGSHFPKETQKICDVADAILFGSVGGPIEESHFPKWKNCERNSILALRKQFSLSANLRPARVFPELSHLCPLKDSRIAGGVDLLIVRELIGDIYFGEHRTFSSSGIRNAIDVAEYSEEQIATAAHQSFKFALKRNRKVTSVDKANVLDTSKLWREVVTEVGYSYPEVVLEHMLVDNCAMQLILNPGQFDVIVTSNLFGDILSDAAAALPGSLGLMPSASFNAKGFGLYEPSGGSAPSLAGQNKANPIAQILSLALLLRYSFELETEAQAIESAVQKCLEKGYRTFDLVSSGDAEALGTTQMTDQILNFI